MKFHETPIADVILIEPKVFADDRGFFLETWQGPKFKAAGIDFVSSYFATTTSCAPFIPELRSFVIDHTLACLLARVAGRSQLEYLTEEEKQAQKRAVLQLMLEFPCTFDELVERICSDAED